MIILEKVLIFVAFLFPLIFFHELGHFLFARFFGVKVEVFSLGFGPKIYKKKRNGTEYALSLIPLGGYIKMFGDDPLGKDQIPKEQRHLAFNYKSKWARFWIVFGGPLANFIFAYFLFYGLLVVGEKVPEARFGTISENSSFYKAGVKPGDVLVKIDKTEILGFTDLILQGPEVSFSKITVRRGTEEIELDINLKSQDFVKDFLSINPLSRIPILVNNKNEFFFLSSVERPIDGTNESFEVMFALDDSLKKGKQFFLHKINYNANKAVQETVDNFLFSKAATGEKQPIIIKCTNDVECYKQFADKNYFPLDLVVRSIVMKSPSDLAGIVAGDIIVKIDGKNAFSFDAIRENLQSVKEGEKVKVLISRSGKMIEKEIIPSMTMQEGRKVFTIGVYSAGEHYPLKFVQGRSYGLFKSMIMALDRTWDTSVKTLDGFKKLITNEVSIKTMGGPIAIGKVASDSLNISLSYFFKIMAFISVNLGMINLFPIPVLDGGHIMFIFMELINRKPLSRRKIEIAQQFGFSVLMLLIFFAIFNDISRFFQ